ncbi:MAG TPA: hypothetical protein VHF89_15795 [Solirubrobacteraceae bacterium]|nr:hypothetical protein [Solirubrobacteraceae bacterium]
MRRFIPLTLLIVLSLAAVATAHQLDHNAPMVSSQPAPLSTVINAGGDDAEWELVGTIATGNPHSDLDFFTIGQDTYASVGSLGIAPNRGGQTLVRLTQDGVVDPSIVSGHPSAACPGIFTSATGLQHDVEATPKGFAFQQQPNPHIARGDAQLLIDSTDGTGRCHDNGSSFGAQGAPQGGLEVIDITNVTQPKEIALISHIGNAHTVNVDPKRPHIAFDITQDGVTVNAQGQRSNETPGSTSNALDGFELIDLSSCMNFPAGTTIEQKREACKPEVYRYRYPEARMATSHTFPNVLQSCHEIEIYPDDRMVCASITSTILFDLSKAFDDRGTPHDYTDDKPRGTPLPCNRRASSSPNQQGLRTGAMVTDCVNGLVNGEVVASSLRVSNWLQNGAPSLEGVEWLGTLPHMGFGQTGQGAAVDVNLVPYDSRQDIVAAHESELTQSGRYVITSDERGGGVVPGGASCTPGADNVRGNGGMHFLPVENFTKQTPLTAEQAHARWARTPEGAQAVYRAQVRTQPQASICTAHVFQQIPGQNRIFMGWYSQGTQVFDFTENEDGTVSFREVGWFTPENANTWTSHVFKAQQNQDGTFTYWGATGDGILPGAGRSAIDVWKVTLPPAPLPRGGVQPGTPPFPISTVKGVENERAASVTAAGGCASSTAFERVGVRPRGRGLAFSFSRRGSANVIVDLFRVNRGRRIGDRRVRRFVNRTGSFRWNGRRGDRGRRVLRNGYFHARFMTRTASGGRDVRRVALVRRNGKWRLRPVFYRRVPCGLAETFKLTRPVFGGTRKLPLSISFRLNQQANVAITVRQRGRVVARVPRRSYVAGRTIRLRVAAARIPRRGNVRVTMRATRTGRATTQTIFARKL